MKFHHHRGTEQAGNHGMRNRYELFPKGGRLERPAAAMKRCLAGALFLALTVSMCAAQASNPGAAAGATQQHGFFPVGLAKSLDSKKLKAGDEVETKLTEGVTTGDGTTIPGGSKIIGHVTEAKARSKGDAGSTLGIVFDRIVRPKSSDLPIKGAIQAAAPSLEADSSPNVSYSGLAEATEKNALPMGRGRSVPILNEQSRGVQEIKNLQLGPEGLFLSTGKEVKLESGTQLLLEVTMP